VILTCGLLSYKTQYFKRKTSVLHMHCCWFWKGFSETMERLFYEKRTVTKLIDLKTLNVLGKLLPTSHYTPCWFPQVHTCTDTHLLIHKALMCMWIVTTNTLGCTCAHTRIHTSQHTHTYAQSCPSVLTPHLDSSGSWGQPSGKLTHRHTDLTSDWLTVSPMTSPPVASDGCLLR
jgi:hypothetical protein